MDKEKNSDSVLYMNTPITSLKDDIIGFSTHVDKLAAAIENGAQMIALTSPFGAGKTSITELLQTRYKEMNEVKVVKISMWSLLGERNDGHNEQGDTAELHKSLLYQLTSQINHSQGTFMSKRLNPSYGLLKLHINKTRYWVLSIIALLLFAIGYILPKVSFSFPLFGEYASVIESCCLLVAFVCVLILVSQSEIVFSSNKSEGGRKIDANEMIHLYRSEVLKEKKRCHRKKTHYIVVIEDLDRTDDRLAVINFLKELRKYYILEPLGQENQTYLNKVTFLINVKPETMLEQEQHDNEEYGHLYAKLFDFVLNLQTINIDDYKAILKGLLDQKAEQIKNIGVTWEGDILNIPGIQWIIRGRRLGIREIKDRLNTAFSLYQMLSTKFGEVIAFEKCAVVAYVTSEYEKEFYQTDDRAFQRIVEEYLKNELNKEKCSEYLPEGNEEYITTIYELVQAKIIDSHYRMYFYNYPQNSRVFTVEELLVQRAILYGEHTEALSPAIVAVIDAKSDIIKDSFCTRKQLGLLLPDIVFQNEMLYIEAVKLNFEEIISWMRNLNYSSEAYGGTIDKIRNILHYDNDRHFYQEDQAKIYCEIWESNFTADALFQLRKVLCKEFSKEIRWYADLFFETHKIISIEELDYLSLSDAFYLINVDATDFSDEIVIYMADRFLRENSDIELSCYAEDFFRRTRDEIDIETQIHAYLAYMEKVVRIVPDFEETIFSEIKNCSEEGKETLFRQYQKIINLCAINNLSEKTLDNITNMDYYDEYSDDVTMQLDTAGYYIDAALQLFHKENRIPFENGSYISAFNNNLEWLADKEQYFVPIRTLMLEHDIDVLAEYGNMFTENYPVITKKELDILQKRRVPISQILSLIPPVLVTPVEVELLERLFSMNKQSLIESEKILHYVAQIDPTLSAQLFYALDFNKIQYRAMSKNKKQSVKDTFWDILSLDTAYGKVDYMAATGYLESDWEEEILQDLKTDKKLQEKYIEIVNARAHITKTTIDVICSLGTLYPMEEAIQNILFKSQKYTEYVVCKALKDNKFEAEAEEKLTILWPVYLDIFGKSDYSVIREIMSKNKEFLECIVHENLYTDMIDEAMLYLAQVDQTKECIIHMYSRDEEFALEYFGQIVGFYDDTAAETFLEIVEQSRELLQSDDLYAHIYPKLPNKVLKSKYTKARRKNGYGLFD